MQLTEDLVGEFKEWRLGAGVTDLLGWKGDRAELCTLLGGGLLSPWAGRLFLLGNVDFLHLLQLREASGRRSCELLDVPEP